MIRKAFERWVRRTWHESYRAGLARNKQGAYLNFDVQQSWFAWQAGWQSRARR